MKKLIKTLFVFACGCYIGNRYAEKQRAEKDKEEFDRLNDSLKKSLDDAVAEGKDVTVVRF